jgi:hypothetical protein
VTPDTPVVSMLPDLHDSYGVDGHSPEHCRYCQLQAASARIKELEAEVESDEALPELAELCDDGEP